MNPFSKVYEVICRCCHALKVICKILGVVLVWLLVYCAPDFLATVLSDIGKVDNSSSNQNYHKNSLVLTPSSPNFSYVELKVKCNGQVCKDAAKEIINSLNTSVDPCDDFYNFACQDWSNDNPRPEYRAEWDPFSKLEKESSDLVIEILTESVNTTDDIPPLVHSKEYYRQCMSIEKLHDEPEQRNKTMELMWDTLEEYGGWPILYKDGQWNSSKFNLVKSIAALRRLFGYIDIVNIGIYQDPDGNVANNSIALLRPTFSTEEDSSDNSDSSMDVPNTAFILNVTKELSHFKGFTNFNETRLKEQISTIQLIPAQLEQVSKRLNNRTLFGFSENIVDTTLDALQNMLDKHKRGLSNEMDLTALLRLLFVDTGIDIVGTEEILVDDLDYLLGASMFISELKKESIANYLHYHMAFQMLQMLPSGNLWGYLNTLKYSQDGTTKPVPRNLICADKVKSRFDFALGHKYAIRRYGNLSTSNEVFEQTRQLFKNIQKSYSALISSSAKTNNTIKNKLLNRLASIAFCSGYPSWIIDNSRVQMEYTGLNFSGSTFFEQTLALNKWMLYKKLKALQQAENAGGCKWTSFLDSVSPNYLKGAVYIPIGILKSPFFDLSLPNSIIYATLGNSLGHELTHGMVFHDDGWTIVDGNRTDMAQCLINYYNNFTFDELHDKKATLDGKNTLAENLPDNVGILAAYQANKADSTTSDKLKGLEKYTDDQLFYIAFAQKWCSSNTLTSMKNSLTDDVHSPTRFRVLGTLQNSREFARAWNCSIGSKMNPDPMKGPKTCTLF